MDRFIIKKLGKIADQIIKLSDEKYEFYTDKDLQAKALEIKESIRLNKKTLEEVEIDAYAICRIAASRILKLKAFRVQLIGALVINLGDIAEMRTGEGKTLTALFPTYLNALSGKGVHIVTVNEYLSQRDSEINGKVLKFLGISVGLNKRNKTPQQKREAYSADVTYTINSELGFDYLRDNMAKKMKQRVQRGLNFAIIDEADSILIDEARTPLIISGGVAKSQQSYILADLFVKSLKDKDYIVDLESKTVALTNSGVLAAQKAFKIKSLFLSKHTVLYHLILNALKANYSFKKDIEYVVKDGEIILIDQFTGRLMEGRSYSDGLQQALQAKEKLKIEEETITMATITYQNFFRLYTKLSGMTGTAKTEEEEFIKIYNTRVVAVPTNKPIIRKDLPDFMFYNRDDKLKQLVKDIKKVHDNNQAVLIGTTSVESSEIVSRYLSKAGFKYEVLNAKNHKREAEIIAKAGQTKAITLATNMAGRGTDIKLSDEVRKSGGLFVFGIERNESRRIDNQLRGRSGRQGDPGSSRFYVSAFDDLMVRYTGDRLSKILESTKGSHFQSRLLTRRISGAQKKVEGMNFDIRKNVLDYDNVISQHRELIYAEREDILKCDNFDHIIKKMQYVVAYDLLKIFSKEELNELYIEWDKIKNAIVGKIIDPGAVDFKELKKLEFSEIAKIISGKMFEKYQKKVEDIPKDIKVEVERQIIIRNIDQHWIQHIDLVTKLRSGIHLRSYSQTNPLHEYIKETANLFEKMKVAIAHKVIIMLITANISMEENILKDSEKEHLEFRQKG